MDSKDEALARQALEARLLYEATTLASETDSPEEALRACVETVCKITGWPVGHVYRPAEDNDFLVSSNIWSLTDQKTFRHLREVTGSTPFALGEGLPGRVWKSGDPAWIFNVEDDEDFARIHKRPNLGIKGAFAFPVKIRGEVVAVPEFFHNREMNRDENLLRLVRSLGEQVGRVIERQRSEVRIRRAEFERDRLFDLSVDMLSIAGIDGYFKRVNPAFKKVLGWTNEELLAKPLFEFVHPGDLDRTHAALKRLANGEELLDFENRYLHVDGSYRWLQWRAVPSGERVYSVARDVTRAKEIDRERRRLEEKMLQAQKLESLGVLAGGIAHDFNNLLSSILGHSELALMDLSPTSPVRADIEMIEKTSIRAADLCKQMLAYSGQGRFVVKRFNLSELIEEMVHLLEVSISKNVTLDFNYAPNLPAIEGDVNQIRQVIMNLITNASEAIGSVSGRITLATGGMVVDASFLQDSPFNDEIEEGYFVFCEVSDTGHGMDANTKLKIFDPFFSTKFTGRGLGLAAVLGIMRSHNGAILVDSKPGQGTTFKLLFPSSKQPAEKVEDEDKSPAYKGQGTVLLVDDDESVLAVTRTLLERLGFSVTVAVDGQDCLEVFDRLAGDIVLVLLDLTMPRLDGEATLHELRRRQPDIRVLMTSGYSEQDRFADQDLAGFIQKPYRLRDLTDKIRELVPG